MCVILPLSFINWLIQLVKNTNNIVIIYISYTSCKLKLIYRNNVVMTENVKNPHPFFVCDDVFFPFSFLRAIESGNWEWGDANISIFLYINIYYKNRIHRNYYNMTFFFFIIFLFLLITAAGRPRTWPFGVS